MEINAPYIIQHNAVKNCGLIQREMSFFFTSNAPSMQCPNVLSVGRNHYKVRDETTGTLITYCSVGIHQDILV